MVSWRLASAVLLLNVLLLRLNYVSIQNPSWFSASTGFSWDTRSFQSSHFVAVAGKTRSNGVIYYLLLLCGDISTNPGPIRHPCTVCDKSVNVNQRGLLCDS